MKDQVTADRISKLHPRIREEVTTIVNNIENSGVGIRIVQGLRTFDEQNNLYAQGRTQAQLDAVGLKNVKARPDLPKVTNARGGESFHNYGLSIDFVLLHADKQVSWSQTEDLDKDGKRDWMEVVEAFGCKGYNWGGFWKSPDYPHFEKSYGLTFQQLLALKNAGTVDKDGYVLLSV